MATEATLADYENLELSQEELSKLLVDSGQSAAEPGILEQAELEEAAVKPEARKRRKALNTGHKLRILLELKQGRNIRLICKEHRISDTTLALIAADDNLQDVVNTGYIEQTKKIIASRFYQLADMALSHIDPQKLERLDAYKLGMLAAIALDKARLIEGQPTENLSFRSLAMSIHGTLSDLQSRKTKLLDLLSVQMSVREGKRHDFEMPMDDGSSLI